MVVKDVDNIELKNFCKSLAYKIFYSSFYPDCILAVPTGGIVPAEMIRDELCQLLGDNSIKLIHIAVKQKRSYIKLSRVIKIYPKCILNSLRVMSLKLKRVVSSRKQKHLLIDIPDNCRNILIVDDAVDTGGTLSSILIELPTHFNIRSAVLSITMRNPIVYPDYYLFNNETILRLPWAIDAK